ncbi:hypothetical protein CYLTODRAFT_424636 [Cylindrobasidium torrendii FP15055 ss-10]|uniref:guanosine-diphosphatase n=1 Tax=Cylindrobasidium torrendii FP15055 ss-10 TaxID=1314674 RepID=A0A0D7B3N3_9AGAR|nr:hypothetical protein CYLTODRAFT_424636 [Cylindrobasidium torrendii FP15055 ss-10]
MLSPRTANYERIEGGMGPSRGVSKDRTLTWKRFAILAAFVIGLVYFFGPRHTKDLPWTDSSVPAAEDIEEPLPTKHLPPVRPTHPTQLPQSEHEPQAPPTTAPQTDITGPASFEEDSNPSGTVHCSKPYSHNLPLIQWALMVDAGSTGSRVHVYKFNNCKVNPSYEYEVFKMTQPGLSSFADSPEKAAQSLDVLLDEAMRVIPKEYRKCAPVEVKATAGLRLLGDEKSEAILRKVRERIEEKYPFSVGTVEVMAGKDEGVYAWITANYLLGTLSDDSKSHTYAVLDLGGASTQIVFEPKWDDNNGKLEDGEHKYDLRFNSKDHVLYQHSYLGYGLMRARRSVHQLVEFMNSIKTSTSPMISNPCLAKGTTKSIEVDGRELSMAGGDVGSFDACNRIVQLVMAKDSVCELKPCSFDGVYQPSLLDSFPGGKVLLLSYFFDRIDPLLPGGKGLTIGGIADLAKDVCAGKTAWLTRWGNDPEAMEELSGRPEHCLDLTFMHGLLQLGYEFDSAREVAIGKKIAGTELGWCLGATLAMIGGELKCRA